MSAELGYISNYLVGVWMEQLGAAPTYVSLHFSDPGVVQDNPSSTEVLGASYARAPVVWSISGARTMVSTNAQQWRGLAETVVTHLGLWNDPYGGQLLAVIPRVSPLYVLANGSFRLESGDLYLSWP
jgi:hypothetical protein